MPRGGLRSRCRELGWLAARVGLGTRTRRVQPRTWHLSRRVRAFVDFLAERFAGVPCWDRCLEEDQRPPP